MSPARVRSARAAQVAAFPEPYGPGGKNLSSEKGGECARAGEKPSLLGLVRAAEPRSLGVAAGNCGGWLPLSALLPPSRRPRGRGGDVSAPPRPPPRAPDPGAPAGSASRTVAAASGQAGPASLPQRCLAVPTAERPPFSTAPRLPRRRRAPAPERPRGAHLSRGLPRRPPPPAFPTSRAAGRKPEQPLQTGLNDLYFSCSPPTSGCDLF
ncbi:formin-like protein 3 [Oryx dammah]|uniref:formin-like protein 3 n=1 Tax=Oryx dammah TaxID=59534 RepID=UPI001A9B3869|nr:formin-like protein 3 [Oryx dammah]